MNLNPFEHRDDFIRMKFSLAPPRGTITFCKFTFIFRLVSHFRLSDHFRFRCHFYHVVRCHLWRSFWKCHFFLEKNDFKFSTRIPVLFRMFDQEPSFYSCYKLKNYFIFDKVPTTGVYYSLKLTIMPPVKVRNSTHEPAVQLLFCSYTVFDIAVYAILSIPRSLENLRKGKIHLLLKSEKSDWMK